MADLAKSSRMTLREFLEWEEKQPHKYEFEDGLIRMMPPGTKRSETIKLNIVGALHDQLRGKLCESYGSGIKVRTFPGAVYYPDAVVDCGTDEDDDTIADKPTVVFEVLSKSTRSEDLSNKLPNYQATPSIQMIVYVETTHMHCMVWRRESGGGWAETEVVRPDERLALEPIGAALSFAEIYEGVAFG